MNENETNFMKNDGDFMKNDSNFVTNLMKKVQKTGFIFMSFYQKI